MFLFARTWMQWYGGLGIVVFSLVLLFGPVTAAKRIAFTEVMEEDLVGGTKAHGHRVLVHSFRPGSRHGNRGSRGPADNNGGGLGMYEG